LGGGGGQAGVDAVEGLLGGDGEEGVKAGLEGLGLFVSSSTLKQRAYVERFGVGRVVGLLGHGSAGVQAKACTSLRFLVEDCTSNRVAFLRGQAGQPLVGLLRSVHTEMHAPACAAIWHLCKEITEVKDMFRESGVAAPLCELLSSQTANVQENAAGCIRSLCVSNVKNQDAFRDAGCVPLLVGLLSSSSPGVQRWTCDALHELSKDNVGNSAVLFQSGVVSALLPLFSSSNSQVRTQSCIAAWNLLLGLDVSSHVQLWKGLHSRVDISPYVSSGVVKFHALSTIRGPAFLRESCFGYYEVEIIKTGTLPKIGFAMPSFASNMECLNQGVGDDEHGWGWDGIRKCFWYDYQKTSDQAICWKDGDVVGFMCNFTSDELVLFKNGVKIHSHPLASKSRAAPDVVFAAVTCNGSTLKLNFGIKERFKFPPSQISTAPRPSLAMFQARDAMEALVSGSNEDAIKAALDGLISCIQNSEEKQRLYVERFGAGRLVGLLGRSNVMVQAKVGRAIKALAVDCRSNRSAFHDAGVVSALAALLSCSAEDLLVSACEAIEVLCVSEPRNQDAFGSAGVVSSLCALLRSTSPSVQEKCSGALAQLVCGHMRNQDVFRDCGGNPVVAGLISSASAGLKNQLCKLVEYLSADNAANASSLSAAGAVASLSDVSAPQKHVMFSYCWAPEAKPEHVRSIASKLPALCGVEAWTDMTGSSFVGKMAGSTDAIMAAAVEASSHVVVCVSREYKNSVNCQQEATYARQFEKKGKLKIIYVMMQSDFTSVSQPDSVDGWLGIMVGNSLWCDPFKCSVNLLIVFASRA
jgi:hypothetical protein